MASDDVKLIGSWTSLFVLRARIALNVKCVEYEFLEENFGSKSDLLLKSNPVYKKIPVLIHGDRPVCESLIIVQYLDDVWASGPKILPCDPYDRAMARFWATYLDDKWYTSLRSILSADEDEAKKAASLEEANQGLFFLENTFKNCSKGQKFFGGDKIGYLDIALGSYLGWIRMLEKMGNVSLISVSDTPNLFKWAQDFSADVAVKDVLPETDRLVEFARVFAARTKVSEHN
ncbi:glutathione s-transferase u18 [Phtheirospermum japonicum]|uniref:glutathione transferase n=1 Tax=Phtheirospermum japonicum TaxID=374723 RepID=A0A830BXR8_9LAMI|nr:glutathione s-transferase u18 [Phtheirospermum japonicum]